MKQKSQLLSHQTSICVKEKHQFQNSNCFGGFRQSSCSICRSTGTDQCNNRPSSKGGQSSRSSQKSQRFYDSHNAPDNIAHPNSVLEQSNSALQNSVLPGQAMFPSFGADIVQQALFPSFDAVPNPYSHYVEPTMYSVQEQQRIIKWNIGIFQFGIGTQYVHTLSLHNTDSRPIELEDNMVFLYCPTISFTPDTPILTLTRLKHVWYKVVHVQSDIQYFDRIGVLLNAVSAYHNTLVGCLLERIYCSHLLRKLH